MLVHRHAEKALVALTQKLPEPASVILARLRAEPAPAATSVALEVARMTMSHGDRDAGGSNGDMVVAIIRDGIVITVMLRRSWNQAFTPEVLRVQEVKSWVQ